MKRVSLMNGLKFAAEILALPAGSIFKDGLQVW